MVIYRRIYSECYFRCNKVGHSKFLKTLFVDANTPHRHHAIRVHKGI